MPTYTYDNFSRHIPVWEEHLLKRAEQLKKGKINILDIGCGEGASTLWFLNNLALGQYARVYSCDQWNQKETEIKFNINIAEDPASHKVVKLKGPIINEMNKVAIGLQTSHYQKFNVIYVNCTTQSLEALTIMLNAFYLLRDDGFMIINNANAKHTINLLGGQAVHYKEAINTFLRLTVMRTEVLYHENQLIVKKLFMSSL